MTTVQSSNSLAISVSSFEVVDIDRLVRWEVYRRLQELAIPCECRLNEPLRVRVDSAATALQLWCVIRAFAASRRDQADHLERCWGQNSKAL